MTGATTVLIALAGFFWIGSIYLWAGAFERRERKYRQRCALVFAIISGLLALAILLIANVPIDYNTITILRT